MPIPHILLALFATAMLLPPSPARAATQAPQGFGSTTTGGAGYPVVMVTNLQDYDIGKGEAEIPGSLRWALSGSDRIVQFAISGEIDLKTKLGIRSVSNVTLDGASAPPPGITIRLDQVEIRGSQNIIVRNIRVRDSADRAANIPGIMVYTFNDRIWIDHCSVTRSSDESIGVYGGPTGSGRPTNVTVSWNLVADAVVPGTPNSGKGILVSGAGSGGPGTAITGEFANRVSVHHNFLTNNDQRNPQVSGNTQDPVMEPLVDLRNNLIHEWTNYGTRFRWNASGNIVRNIYMSSVFPENSLVLELPGPVYTAGNVSPLSTFNSMGTSATPIAVPPIAEHTTAALPAALLGDGITTGVGALPRDAYDSTIITRDARDLGQYLSTCSLNGGNICSFGETCDGGVFTPSVDAGSLCCVGGTCSAGGVPQDSDGDGVPDASDNCPGTYNPSQTDTDGDGIGDACDTCTTGFDADGDGVCDGADNCPGTYNPSQTDTDGDGIGDACDRCFEDTDGDGVCDSTDNCLSVPNPAQTDTDGDGIGDACDACVTGLDADQDGICDSQDNCPTTYNPTQTDTDRDGIGDACEGCLTGQDADHDGVCDGVDNCPTTYNPAQTDTDRDGVGDACDVCPTGQDTDGDGVCDSSDNCPMTYNPSQTDTDQDGVGDACDLCLPDQDADGDGVCDGADNCPTAYNPAQADTDQDGVGDACDLCPVGQDTDGDGVCDVSDNCPTTYNPAQTDSDGDGTGDACDVCPLGQDSDGDGVCDVSDNCPSAYNPGQSDSDGDGIGDVCDVCFEDTDGDHVCDAEDNCLSVYNPGQDDGDGDGFGDACDSCPDTAGPCTFSVTTPIQASCSSPPPAIAWFPGGNDKFRVLVAADPAFTISVSSGSLWLTTTNWRMPSSDWLLLCTYERGSIYVQVMGTDVGTGAVQWTPVKAVPVN